MKRIRMEREHDGLPVSSLREIALLKTLNHQNIVSVRQIAVGRELDSIYLVMEYCHHVSNSKGISSMFEMFHCRLSKIVGFCL